MNAPANNASSSPNPSSSSAENPLANPFAVLGLPADPDLTDEDIHAAWRLLLRDAHPDRGGSEEAAALITAAYRALRTGVRRAEALELLDAHVEVEHVIDDRSTAPDAAPETGPAADPASDVLDDEPVERSRAPRPQRPAPKIKQNRQLRVPVWTRAWLRLRHGRPHWLAARIILAGALPVTAYVLEPEFIPAWATLAVGAITFLAATAHLDLGPRVPRRRAMAQRP